MSFILFLRGAANSAARNRQFSTIFGRRSLQCHQAIQHERLNLTSKFAISTTPVTFKRLRPNEIQEKITRLERRKTENQAKAERNKKLVGIIDVYPGMTVGQLTKAVGRTHEQIVDALTRVAQIREATQNMELNDLGIIKKVAHLCGYKIKSAVEREVINSKDDDRDVYPRPAAPAANLQPRPPVVTVMGHVDHGKTTLLDTLRGASVAKGEAGGITQHIGAFMVEMETGEMVTFLDTPGHAAFSSMRARGASCTDIVVLVIASEDSVMPQTREVLDLVRAGDIPMVVAINKIDSPNADVEKTKKDLLGAGVDLEGYGGNVQWACISGMHGTNLDKLVDAILTEAILQDLKSEYTGLVEGVVIESRTDPLRGKLSTMIVTRGTLRKGCFLVAGTAHARVRSLFDNNNNLLNEVTPGMPAEILGWVELPNSGEIILEVPTAKKANAVIKMRQLKHQDQKSEADLIEIEKKREEHDKIYRSRRWQTSTQKKEITWQEMHAAAKKSDSTPAFNIVLKTDVHGSLEAILDVIDTYDNNDVCRLNVVHYGVGPVADGDITMAETFNAIVYSFSMKIPPSKQRASVEMRSYNIIYRLIENIQEEIAKRLPEIDVEDVVGEAKVLQVFQVNERNKKIPVLGCRCVDGTLKKNLMYKIMRNGEKVFEGKLRTMRHQKTDVTSIKKNTECGLQLDDSTFQPESDDKVICYVMKKDNMKIDWNPVGFSDNR